MAKHRMQPASSDEAPRGPTSRAGYLVDWHDAAALVRSRHSTECAGDGFAVDQLELVHQLLASGRAGVFVAMQNERVVGVMLAPPPTHPTGHVDIVRACVAPGQDVERVSRLLFLAARETHRDLGRREMRGVVPLARHETLAMLLRDGAEITGLAWKLALEPREE